MSRGIPVAVLSGRMWRYLQLALIKYLSMEKGGGEE